MIVESYITEIAMHSILPISGFSTIGKGELPKIGTFNMKSRANRSNRLSEAEYLSIPKSFIAFLVGFIDGDGYILVNKSEKGYIGIKLLISIHLDDIAVLNYIQSVLKLGRIYTFPKHKSPCARLVLSKTDLQEVLFPLLVYHGIYFLTETRRAQYHMAMHALTHDIKIHSELPKVAPVLQELPKFGEGYVQLSFFKDWLVGFVVAEGSFFVKCNNDGCFQIKQRLHLSLFEAFKVVFDTTRKVSIDKLSHAQFSVSSKADIQKVINFFSFSGHHSLIGLKSIQYSAWLDSLRSSVRYGKLNFPQG